MGFHLTPLLAWLQRDPGLNEHPVMGRTALHCVPIY